MGEDAQPWNPTKGGTLNDTEYFSASFRGSAPLTANINAIIIVFERRSMLNVPIDKIIPLTEARDTLSKIIADVEQGAPLYVLTKNGKPSVAIMSVDVLQKQVGEINIPSFAPSPSPPSKDSVYIADKTDPFAAVPSFSAATPPVSSPNTAPQAPPVAEPIITDGVIPSRSSGQGVVSAPMRDSVDQPPAKDPAKVDPGYSGTSAQYDGQSHDSPPPPTSAAGQATPDEPDDMPIG